MSREQAEKLVTDPAAVARYSFFPLIAFSKRERHYRRRLGAKKPTARIKVRELAYPAHADGHIFAYYAEQLGKLYETELAKRDLGKVVIAYRKGASNVRLARDAFAEIQGRGDCIAIALDIKGFFDNIDHDVLKRCWSDLLGGGPLPDDHYAVYRALTTAGKIDRDRLLQLLGFPLTTRDRDLPRPICSVTQFQNLRRTVSGCSKLVQRCTSKRGIPQGTPLSGMAANIAMLEFDSAVQAAAVAVGASYRRYSDDILILCPPEAAGAMEATVRAALVVNTRTLTLNPEKTERVRFSAPGPVLAAMPPRLAAKPLQYLGFTFDGRQVLIRGGTLSRYYRRAAAGVHMALASAGLARQGKLPGRNTVHKREVFAKHSHLGIGNFVKGYAKGSAGIMGILGAQGIRHQLAQHMKVLRRRLCDKESG